MIYFDSLVHHIFNNVYTMLQRHKCLFYMAFIQYFSENLSVDCVSHSIKWATFIVVKAHTLCIIFDRVSNFANQMPITSNHASYWQSKPVTSI